MLCIKKYNISMIALVLFDIFWVIKINSYVKDICVYNLIRFFELFNIPILLVIIVKKVVTKLSATYAEMTHG